MEYTHLLQCLDHSGEPKYELPSNFLGENPHYWIYIRPYPIVHHKKKKKTFLLPHPELVLVSKEENHCISIALDHNGNATNMYININHPPEKIENGHSWRDLELDILMTIKNGNWTAELVDEEEFAAAPLSDRERTLARDEVTMLFKKIERKEFPFAADLSEFEKLIDKY